MKVRSRNSMSWRSPSRINLFLITLAVGLMAASCDDEGPNAPGQVVEDRVHTIRSVDYMQSQFFRLTAPVSFYFTDPDSFPGALQDSSLTRVQSEQNMAADWAIDYPSLQLYRSVGAGVSHAEAIDGAAAYLDPTGIGFEGFGMGAGDPLTPGDGSGVSAFPESGFNPAIALAGLPHQYRERWERLQAWEEWSIVEVNGQIIGVQLARPAGDNEVIACSYNIVDVTTGFPPTVVRRVGRSSEDGEDGRIVDPTSPSRNINYFKLLKPGVPTQQPFANGAYTIFALTWEYEYRNFYDLGGREIDPVDFAFFILGIDPDLDPPDRVPADVDPYQTTFIRVFGLDRQARTGVQTPDGVADIEDGSRFYLRPGFLRFDHPTPFDLPDDVVSANTDGSVTTIPLGGPAPALYTRILTTQERTALHRFNLEARWRE